MHKKLNIYFTWRLWTHGTVAYSFSPKEKHVFNHTGHNRNSTRTQKMFLALFWRLFYLPGSTRIYRGWRKSHQSAVVIFPHDIFTKKIKMIHHVAWLTTNFSFWSVIWWGSLELVFPKWRNDCIQMSHAKNITCSIRSFSMISLIDQRVVFFVQLLLPFWKILQFLSWISHVSSSTLHRGHTTESYRFKDSVATIRFVLGYISLLDIFLCWCNCTCSKITLKRSFLEGVKIVSFCEWWLKLHNLYMMPSLKSPLLWYFLIIKFHKVNSKRYSNCK